MKYEWSSCGGTNRERYHEEENQLFGSCFYATYDDIDDDNQTKRDR